MTPGETLAQTPDFPDLFTNQYRTGEISGSLDVTLRRMHTLYAEQGMSQLRAFVEWVPRLLFLLVAALVAYVVITFWMGYFKTIGDAINL